MTDQSVRHDGVAAGRTATIQLAVKKGSRIIPLLLMAVMIVLFISDHMKGLSGPAFGALLASKAPVAEMIMGGVKTAVIEFFRAFAGNFRSVVKGTLYTVGVLSLYALVPGIAGLIYRRSFWRWFLIGFVVLYGVASMFSPRDVGVLGLISGTEVEGVAASATSSVPGSAPSATAATPAPAGTMAPATGATSTVDGTIPAKPEVGRPAGGRIPGMDGLVFFLISQLVLLLLAFRLHRHTSSAGVIPPAVYNGLLAAALALIAYACYMKIGPDGLWDAVLPNRFYRWEFMLLMLPATYLLVKRRLSWPSTERKNIVVCLDGTNNTPGQTDLGRVAQTNVLKLFDMLKQDRQQGRVINALIPAKGQFDATLTKRYANKQIAFYYSGVGNSIENSPILDVLGLATGLGADSIVDRAYLDIMRVYRPGDRIFIFGFSRGAAIARLLARTIDQKGAPRKMWSLRLFGRHWTIWSSDKKQHDVPIAVLGCWDTVGAFGVAKTIAGIDFGKVNAFKDLSIPDNVRQAYHLLALDEQRDSFAPTLMDPDPLTPERIIEVWFSGDHSNVGGSWATDKLSDVTLDFMLSRVSSGYIVGKTGEPGNEDWGLHLSGVNGRAYEGKITDDLVVLNPDPLGQLRQVTSMVYNTVARKLPIHAIISESVIQRMMLSEPVYAPQSLFDLNDELDKKRDMIDEKVARLEETGSLKDTERVEIFKVKAKLRLTRWPAYWEKLQITTPLPPERLSNKKAPGPGEALALAANGGGVL
jgi:uncharacterized protein (DUF2235 family)